jgi:hypothetical protein
VNNNVGSGNLLGALSEAAFMIGMERNSDIVTMASYAPLFENVNNRAWAVNPGPNPLDTTIRIDGAVKSSPKPASSRSPVTSRPNCLTGHPPPPEHAPLFQAARRHLNGLGRDAPATSKMRQSRAGCSGFRAGEHGIDRGDDE